MRRQLLLVSMVTFSLLTLFFGVKPVRAENPNIAIYSDQYRDFLDKYRLQYDKTSLSLQQYSNLKTLASQEEAVQSMRDFLLIRADVVTAHLNILSVTLGDRQGLEPSQQASASGLIDHQKQLLLDHRSRSDIAVDRIKADQEAVWFSQNQKDLLMTADRASSLIGIGKVNEAIAALVQVKSHLDTWISSASMSETQRVEKRRGSDELGRAIDAAKASQQTAQQYYTQAVKNNSTALQYANIRPMLLTAYTHVQRGVGFAKELSQ